VTKDHAARCGQLDPRGRGDVCRVDLVSIGEQLVGAERERYGVGLDDQDLVHLGLAAGRERRSWVGRLFDRR
jgi:hypothetical protein